MTTERPGKKWSVSEIEQKKDYAYIPLLMAQIFRQRALKKDEGVHAYVSIAEDDPRRTALTIASVPPPPTSELKKQQKTRFGKSE